MDGNDNEIMISVSCYLQDFWMVNMIHALRKSCNSCTTSCKQSTFSQLSESELKLTKIEYQATVCIVVD